MARSIATEHHPRTISEPLKLLPPYDFVMFKSLFTWTSSHGSSYETWKIPNILIIIIVIIQKYLFNSTCSPLINHSSRNNRSPNNEKKNADNAKSCRDCKITIVQMNWHFFLLEKIKNKRNKGRRKKRLENDKSIRCYEVGTSKTSHIRMCARRHSHTKLIYNYSQSNIVGFDRMH